MSKKVWKFISFILSMVLFIGSLSTNSISVSAATRDPVYYDNIIMYNRWYISSKEDMLSRRAGGRDNNWKVMATFFDYGGDGYSEYVYHLPESFSTKDIEKIRIKGFHNSSSIYIRLYTDLSRYDESAQEEWPDLQPDNLGYMYIKPGTNTGVKREAYRGTNYNINYIGFLGKNDTKISIEDITIFFKDNDSSTGNSSSTGNTSVSLVTDELQKQYSNTYYAKENAATAEKNAKKAFDNAVSWSNRTTTNDTLAKARSYQTEAENQRDEAIRQKNAANNALKYVEDCYKKSNYDNEIQSYYYWAQQYADAATKSAEKAAEHAEHTKSVADTMEIILNQQAVETDASEAYSIALITYESISNLVDDSKKDAKYIDKLVKSLTIENSFDELLNAQKIANEIYASTNTALEDAKATKTKTETALSKANDSHNSTLISDAVDLDNKASELLTRATKAYEKVAGKENVKGAKEKIDELVRAKITRLTNDAEDALREANKAKSAVEKAQELKDVQTAIEIESFISEINGEKENTENEKAVKTIEVIDKAKTANDNANKALEEAINAAKNSTDESVKTSVNSIANTASKAATITATAAADFAGLIINITYNAKDNLSSESITAEDITAANHIAEVVNDVSTPTKNAATSAGDTSLKGTDYIKEKNALTEAVEKANTKADEAENAYKNITLAIENAKKKASEKAAKAAAQQAAKEAAEKAAKAAKEAADNANKAADTANTAAGSAKNGIEQILGSDNITASEIEEALKLIEDAMKAIDSANSATDLAFKAAEDAKKAAESTDIEDSIKESTKTTAENLAEKAAQAATTAAEAAAMLADKAASSAEKATANLNKDINSITIDDVNAASEAAKVATAASEKASTAAKAAEKAAGLTTGEISENATIAKEKAEGAASRASEKAMNASKAASTKKDELEKLSNAKAEAQSKLDIAAGNAAYEASNKVQDAENAIADARTAVENEANVSNASDALTKALAAKDKADEALEAANTAINNAKVSSIETLKEDAKTALETAKAHKDTADELIAKAIENAKNAINNAAANATNKVNDANTKANDAKTKADNAKSAAETAKNTPTESNIQSASTSINTADTAISEADTAISEADTAISALDTAKDSLKELRKKANDAVNQISDMAVKTKASTSIDEIKDIDGESKNAKITLNTAKTTKEQADTAFEAAKNAAENNANTPANTGIKVYDKDKNEIGVLNDGVLTGNNIPNDSLLYDDQQRVIGLYHDGKYYPASDLSIIGDVSNKVIVIYINNTTIIVIEKDKAYTDDKGNLVAYKNDDGKVNPITGADGTPLVNDGDKIYWNDLKDSGTYKEGNIDVIPTHQPSQSNNNEPDVGTSTGEANAGTGSSTGSNSSSEGTTNDPTADKQNSGNKQNTDDNQNNENNQTPTTPEEASEVTPVVPEPSNSSQNTPAEESSDVPGNKSDDNNESDDNNGKSGDKDDDSNDSDNESTDIPVEDESSNSDKNTNGNASGTNSNPGGNTNNVTNNITITNSQYTIIKQENTLIVSTSKKPKKIKFNPNKKKKNYKISKFIQVRNAQGPVNYKKVSGNKKIKINPKTGMVTLKRGLKKGKTYRMKIRVMAEGNDYFNPVSKDVTVKFKIK